jgi:hypothetical protein
MSGSRRQRSTTMHAGGTQLVELLESLFVNESCNYHQYVTSSQHIDISYSKWIQTHSTYSYRESIFS